MSQRSEEALWNKIKIAVGLTNCIISNLPALLFTVIAQTVQSQKALISPTEVQSRMKESGI